MRKLLSCQGERILLQTWPRRIMENYLPEGGAKNHENNGRKGYSQGTKLEPSQGVFPTSSLGTWQYLPRKISELLQTQASDCFPFCNGLFLFVTPTPFYCGTLCVCVCVGEGRRAYCSANTHLCLPFLICINCFLPSPPILERAIWVVLANECE